MSLKPKRAKTTGRREQGPKGRMWKRPSAMPSMKYLFKTPRPYSSISDAIGTPKRIDFISNMEERPTLRCVSPKGKVYYVWPIFGKNIKGGHGRTFKKGELVGYARLYTMDRKYGKTIGNLPKAVAKDVKKKSAIYYFEMMFGKVKYKW